MIRKQQQLQGLWTSQEIRLHQNGSKQVSQHPAQIVNGSPPDNTARAVTVVQQFMAEYNGAVSKA
jgi:hypothetical protein